MDEGNYEKVLVRIAKSAGLDKEEVQRRVEAKRAKLSGLISPEGAAQVIAAELGISFDNEMFKIDELLPGMRKVNVVGKIISLYPVRSFTNKSGQEGKVANMIVADTTSNVKVVLWDMHHIELIEKGEIKEGSVIEIGNGSVRDNEIHLGSFSELKPSTEVFENVQTEKVVKEKSIIDFKPSDSASVRAFIVQSFDPRFFHVCPECKKKAVEENGGHVCAEHGKVVPEKRALVNFVIDDGTETIRTVVFSDLLPSLGLTALEDANLLSQQKENLLGREMIFSGNVRINRFFNNPEFIVDGVKDLDIGELVAKLETK